MNKIPHPVTLTGNLVELVPLETHHFEELCLAASDQELWKFVPTDCSNKETFYKAYQFALDQRELGKQYTFVIKDKQTGSIIGSTRFFEIYLEDKKLEIGWTWITKPNWGSSVNLECKLLLLTYCFDVLKLNRVQLKTKDTNIRSQKAIGKIGATFEGILRKDKIQHDGTTRNAAYFSILDDEWLTAKSSIEAQIEEYAMLNV